METTPPQPNASCDTSPTDISLSDHEAMQAHIEAPLLASLGKPLSEFSDEEIMSLLERLRANVQVPGKLRRTLGDEACDLAKATPTKARRAPKKPVISDDYA